MGAEGTERPGRLDVPTMSSVSLPRLYKRLVYDTQMARGLGCEGLYAESLAEVESALAKARDVAGPVVICVRTDRTANLGVAPEAGMRFAEVYQGPM